MILWFLLSFAHAEMPAQEEFARKFSVALGTVTQSFGLDFTGERDVQYAPNSNTLTTIGVNYAGIGGLTYGTRNGLDAEARQKGSTTYDDFRLNLPFRRLAVFLYYARYRGYYVVNSESIESRPASAPYLLYPNLYTQNFGGSLTWVWNPEKYSLAAVMDMSERQIKSGGSVLTGVSATETFIRNEGPILPSQVRSSYDRDGEMNEGRLRALSVKIGYGYTEVYRRRYFASILGTAGLGAQEIGIGTPLEDYVLRRASLNFYELYGGLGFNGDTWFAGLNAFTVVNEYRAAVAKISTQVATISLTFGLRL